MEISDTRYLSKHDTTYCKSGAPGVVDNMVTVHWKITSNFFYWPPDPNEIKFVQEVREGLGMVWSYGLMPNILQ